MKRVSITIVIILSLVSAYSSEVTAPLTEASVSSDSGRTFYVDNISGNDGNVGMSRGKAWAGLGKVNSVTFKPGDRILFKAGTIYTGQLKPKGSGKKGKPIIIDMYGVGNKPRFDGKGEYLDTVLLENVQYWEVNNLEITNLSSKRQEWQTGIRVRANSFGTMRHIQLKDLYVHDVNGSLVKETEGCGIFAQCDGKKKSRFDGLLIEDCHVVRTDRNGICMRSEFTDRAKNWFASLNVVIRGNLIEDCGGDCIKPWGAEGCLVEYNVVRGGRQRCKDYAAGIWPWSTDDALIQYNEVSGIKGTKDGQAFDSDYNCTNTVFQYNYSHDNDGGFILVCAGLGPDVKSEKIGTVIRYNISQNDMERTFHIAGDSWNTYIYNNVVYVKEGIDIPLVLFTNWGQRNPDNTYFYNNVFYADGKLRYTHSTKWLDEGKYEYASGFGGSTNVVFSNNVYYGNHIDPPKDAKAITSDPMLAEPGSGGDGFNSLDGYKLKAGSPCIGTGRTIEESGVLDFWGNKINRAKPSIGVHEKAN